MRINRISRLAAIAGLGLALSVPLAAIEYDPIFDFIPLGGRSLLSEIFADDPPAAEVQALLTAERSPDQWLAYLKARGDDFPRLQQFDDWELQTLADYLHFSVPLPAEAVPSDPATADWNAILPIDGRDMALEYCQSCHIITVTITQDRSREAWLGTMSNPSHIEIKLTPRQREALAAYLVVNAGIPIDQVPEDLRAGGASY